MGRVVRALGLAALMLALAGCWPMPGQNPDRTGHNPFESQITPANVAALTQRWNVAVATSDVTAPAVSSAGIHVTAQSSSGASLYTYRASDGALMWAAPLVGSGPTFLEHGPAVVIGDHVLAGWHAAVVGGTYPNDAGTSSFDVTTGAGGSLGTGPGWGPVVAARGHVIVTSALWRQRIFQWVSSAVIDLDDPSTLWTTSTLSPPALSGNVTLGEQRLYDASAPPGAWSPTDGAVLWTAPDGTTPQTSPVISPDQATIYLDSFEGIIALDAATGAVRWTGSIPAGLRQPSLAEGTLFVPTEDGRILAYAADGCDQPTCDPLWQASTGTTSPIYQQPAIAGGVLFVGTFEGQIYAFDAAGCDTATCSPLWSMSTGSQITGAPAVSRGQLYVGTANGHLIAYGIP